jgi:hypothetical protein
VEMADPKRMSAHRGLAINQTVLALETKGLSIKSVLVLKDGEGTYEFSKTVVIR